MSKELGECEMLEARNESGRTTGWGFEDVAKIEIYRDTIVLEDIETGRRMIVQDAGGWQCIFDAVEAVSGQLDGEFVARTTRGEASEIIEAKRGEGS